MSGTSQDGVDIALIEADGDNVSRFGATAHRSYSTPERAFIRGATAAAVNITERAARPEIVATLEAAVNEVHVKAVATFLAANGLPPIDIAVGLRFF
jgi:anhydro-N-acetylmuramic acid kinase